MKGLSAFLLMHIRLFRRPAGRSWIFDLLLVYSGIYSFMLSNVIGVYKAWPLYEDLTKKMIASNKKSRSEDIMNFTQLEDFKCYFYKIDNNIFKHF